MSLLPDLTAFCSSRKQHPTTVSNKETEINDRTNVVITFQYCYVCALVVQRITFGSISSVRYARDPRIDLWKKKKKLCTCSVQSKRGHGERSNEGIWTPRVIYLPCMGKRGLWIKPWRCAGTVVEGCIGIGSRRVRVSRERAVWTFPRAGASG